MGPRKYAMGPSNSFYLLERKKDFLGTNSGGQKFNFFGLKKDFFAVPYLILNYNFINFCDLFVSFVTVLHCSLFLIYRFYCTMSSFSLNLVITCHIT